ncbi:hypothetical protein NL676_016903 [Syzygium grande]|nr:hypothetical protein NL676_016903 [Syzygium grande]
MGTEQNASRDPVQLEVNPSLTREVNGATETDTKKRNQENQEPLADDELSSIQSLAADTVVGSRAFPSLLLLPSCLRCNLGMLFRGRNATRRSAASVK